MIILNVGKRYADLININPNMILIESNKGVIEYIEELDLIIESKKDAEIFTLCEPVVNRIGYMIVKGYINPKDIIVKVYENKKLKFIAEFNEEGYAENWEIGFFAPSKKEIYNP